MGIKVGSRRRLLAMVVGLALLALTLPAQAVAVNTTTGDGVLPLIIPHFGGDDCRDPNVGATAAHSLTIVNPVSGPFVDSDTNLSFTLNVSGRVFGWTKPASAVIDKIVVKGGTDANLYNYVGSVGVDNGDTNLHAPPASKGNNFQNLSHVTICYGLNQAPTANPDTYTVSEDGVLNAASVLANDTDPESDLLTATKLTDPTDPAKGVITNFVPAGTFTYTPNPNANGSDSFTYRATATGGTSVATVTINITPVNDLPVAGNDSTSVVAPATSVVINVLGNDTDVETSPLVIITNLSDPPNGTAVLGTGADIGKVVYTPTPGFGGTDTFTYTANDGTADSNTATVRVTVFEGDINCNQTVNPDGGPFVTKRGVDTDGDCKGASGELLFTYDQGPIIGGPHDGRRFVDFVASNPNPLAGDGQARFIETITWDVDKPLPGADQFGPLYYDDHVSQGFRLMPWCATDLWDDGTGLPVFPGLADPSPLPSGHTSCLIHSETFVSGTGLTSIDYVYNEADGGRAR